MSLYDGNWRIGFTVLSRLIRIDGGRAPTWGRNCTPSAFSRSAKPQISSAVFGATRVVTGRPVRRAMYSIQYCSSGLAMWSEMISTAPWPTEARASPMPMISSAVASVPGTVLPCLSMWP